MENNKTNSVYNKQYLINTLDKMYNGDLGKIISERGELPRSYFDDKYATMFEDGEFEKYNEKQLMLLLDKLRDGLRGLKTSGILENSDNNLRSVTVYYKNGDHITTSMNGKLTDEEIHDYYKPGKWFNIGNGPKDNMQQVDYIVINEEKNNTEFKVGDSYYSYSSKMYFVIISIDEDGWLTIGEDENAKAPKTDIISMEDFKRFVRNGVFMKNENKINEQMTEQDIEESLTSEMIGFLVSLGINVNEYTDYIFNEEFDSFILSFVFDENYEDYATEKELEDMIKEYNNYGSDFSWSCHINDDNYFQINVSVAKNQAGYNENFIFTSINEFKKHLKNNKINESVNTDKILNKIDENNIRGIKLEIHDTHASVLVDVDKQAKLWVDVWVKDGDVYHEYNKYIFRRSDNSDMIELALQDELYEEITSAAVWYLEDKNILSQDQNAEWSINLEKK